MTVVSLYHVYLDIHVIVYFVYTGQAYNLEKQSEPGISIPGYNNLDILFTQAKSITW